jgi:hypothetical protein
MMPLEALAKSPWMLVAQHVWQHSPLRQEMLPDSTLLGPRDACSISNNPMLDQAVILWGALQSIPEFDSANRLLHGPAC